MVNWIEKGPDWRYRFRFAGRKEEGLMIKYYKNEFRNRYNGIIVED